MNLYFISMSTDMNGESRDQLVRADTLQQAYAFWWEHQLQDLANDEGEVKPNDWLPETVFMLDEPTDPTPGIVEWHSETGMKPVWTRKDDSPAILLSAPTTSPSP